MDRKPSIESDLRARMRPSAENLAEAAAAMTAAGYPMAIVPIAFPGKEHGWWKLDTVVENPSGAWACENDETFYAARNNACEAAALHLGERPGTVGYVVVYADRAEHWAVFEDILPPLRHLELAAERTSAHDPR